MPIRFRHSLHASSVLGANIVAALLCLVLLTTGAKSLPIELYSEFLIFVGLVNLGNYALAGLPEVYVKEVGQGSAHPSLLKMVLTRGFFSCFLCSALYFLAAIAVTFASHRGSDLARPLISAALVILPQGILLLLRTHLETELRQLTSAILKGCSGVALYFSPLFCRIWDLPLGLYSAVYGIALSGMILFIILQPGIRKQLRSETHTAPPAISFQAGYWINLLWALSILTPLLDRVISRSILPVDASFPIGMLSEFSLRFAILYGTIGQYAFPFLAKSRYRPIEFQAIILRSLLGFGVLLLAAAVALLVFSKFPIAMKALPNIAIADNSILILFFIVLCNGCISLFIRPLFLMSQEKTALPFLICSTVLFAALEYLVASSTETFLWIMLTKSVVDASIILLIYLQTFRHFRIAAHES